MLKALSLVLLALGYAIYRKLYRHLSTARKGLSATTGHLGNLPGPRAASFIAGSLQELYSLDGWDYHREVVDQYGSAVNVKGLFGANRLFVSDPAALYNIFNKNQAIFEETSSFISINKLAYGDGLLSVLGEQHHKQRKMLNPVFSVSNLRRMLPAMYEVSKKLRDAFQVQVEKGPQEIDMVSWMTRTTLEVIGQCGLGYSFDDLTEDAVPHPYSVAIKKFIPTLFKLRYSVGFLLPFFSKIGSPRFRRFVVNVMSVPWRNLHDIRDMFDVMDKTSREILEAKKEALCVDTGGEKVGVLEKDIMSILRKCLVRANASSSPSESLSDEELLGQISVLVFAAMDTSSTVLSRLLHHLSLNRMVQDRLRQEINDAAQLSGDEHLSYEDLMSLPYLDAICRETLRLNPPVTVVERVARADAVVPLSTPIEDIHGQEIREIFIEKGTEVTAAVKVFNCDPNTWGPDGYEWNPDRWLKPLPQEVQDIRQPGIYSNIMTFIGGSRACMAKNNVSGFKFAELEIKLLIYVLIQSFRFSPSKVDVEWHMTMITTPAVKGSEKPMLPLVVERVDPQTD